MLSFSVMSICGNIKFIVFIPKQHFVYLETHLLIFVVIIIKMYWSTEYTPPSSRMHLHLYHLHASHTQKEQLVYILRYEFLIIIPLVNSRLNLCT